MDIAKLEGLFESRLADAEQGWRMWTELVSEHGISHTDCIMLFPSEDKRINYTFLLYLNQFMGKRYRRAYLITCDENVAKYGGVFSDKIKVSVILPRASAEKLMSFYVAAANYIRNLYVCSLTEPPLRNFYNDMKAHGLLLEEAVCHWVYRMPKFERAETNAEAWDNWQERR